MPAEIQGHNGPMIHLQGLGPCSAKPAAEFQVGEVTRWNYGFCREREGYTIDAIETVSAKFAQFTLRHDLTGTVSDRRLKADRLVAYFREDGRR